MRITYTLFALLISYLAYTQTGTIKGVIIDAANNEEIIGANIFLDGTNKGTTSDFDGTFEITNVPPGVYKLLCLYIGYNTDTTTITITGGETVEANVSMVENVNVLDVVTVTAVRKTSTDVAVLSVIRQSMQVVSGLSAESIKKTSDSDASQVVRRIPGVTVVNNRFIIIRGLNERYNSTQLHGVNVPSMESDVRSFSFDVIPSNIIDQILIYKSPGADLPGDFSGGAVKVFTKSIPDQTGITLDVSTGFRQGSSLRTFFAERRRNGYWTGLNDGRNDLPADFPDRLSGLLEDQIAAIGRSLPNNWAQQEYNSGLDYKVALTLNFKKDLNNQMQVGNITSLQYNNSKTIFNSENRAFEVFDIPNNESKVRFDFEDVEYSQEIMAGAIHNWAFRLNKNNVIEFKNLFNYLTTYEFVERFGEQRAQSFTQNNFAFFNEYRGLYSGQLVGNHRFNKEATKVEWVGGYGISYNQLPDYRRYRRNVVDINTRESVLLVPRGQTPDFLGRFYSEMTENIYSGAVNLEHKFLQNKVARFKPILKIGALIEDRERNFDARNLGFTRGFSFDESLIALSVAELFNPKNINPESGVRLGENFSSSNFFVAENKLRAYYASINLPIGRFNLLTGVRLEDNVQTLRSPDRFVAGGTIPPIAPVEIDQTFLLPSGTLSYNITDKTVLKAVYGRTINRPEFREIAPFGFYNFTFDATAVGFPLLKNATVDNFDLRWEYYPNPRETVSFALFYKNFQDPIESLYSNFGSEQITFLFRNAESAFARGLEIDLRKSLSGLTTVSWINNTSVLANISLIDSEVKIGDELASILRAKDRPLQGQSGFIINTGLFFDDVARSLQVNLLYNVIGKRILLVGAAAIPDTYEMPRHVIDLNVRKGITEQLTLKLGVKDILNQEFLLLQDGNEDGNFDRQNDQRLRAYRPGVSYSIGFTYDLKR
jgi:outer membrane receptor protein involved in Fe transport